jgi:hypothetical protein
MVMKLYLDGCSLTYGQGLERDKNLGYLFEKRGHYQVTDKSRPGKSNLLIATDTYEQYCDYDVFVLGFTFAERFGIKYHNDNLDFFPGFHGQGLDLSTKDLDDAHIQLHKYFYTVFENPFCDNLSNMLIDGLVSFLIKQGKTVIPFSWQTRNTKNKLFYPYIMPADRLSDGHLNEAGVLKLYDLLQDYNAKQR